MPRQFNPDLFESPSNLKEEPSSFALGQIETLKRRIRDLEQQNRQMQQKIDKLCLHFESKLSGANAQHKTFESGIKQSLDNLEKTQTSLHHKLMERKVVDTKMNELIDRHNQLVQNFETRMSQTQKVTKDQEMKLATYQSTLNEILREIKNLK